jgi:hypothetical protein
LIFTRVPAGKPAIGVVCLYGYQSDPLKILGHEFLEPDTAEYFEVACHPMPAEQVAEQQDAVSGCLLRVKVKPSLVARPFRQQMVLRTNVDLAPTVEVPVQGTVGGEIAVAGFGWDEQSGVLTLGTVAAAKGTERTFHVVVRGPHAKKLELKPIRIVPDLLEVEAGSGQQLGAGPVFRFPLTIRIPPRSRAANHLGTKPADLGQIVIETGHPQEPELRLLVRFAVKPDVTR